MLASARNRNTNFCAVRSLAVLNLLEQYCNFSYKNAWWLLSSSTSSNSSNKQYFEILHNYITLLFVWWNLQVLCNLHSRLFGIFKLFSKIFRLTRCLTLYYLKLTKKSKDICFKRLFWICITMTVLDPQTINWDFKNVVELGTKYTQLRSQ